MPINWHIEAGEGRSRRSRRRRTADGGGGVGRSARGRRECLLRSGGWLREFVFVSGVQEGEK
jgi:hypothetical protein